MQPICPICGCSRPIWTKELPTKSGIYYFWDDNLGPNEYLVVQITPFITGELQVNALTQNRDLYFDLPLKEVNGEWIGPLPRPKKRR